MSSKREIPGRKDVYVPRDRHRAEKTEPLIRRDYEARSHHTVGWAEGRKEGRMEGRMEGRKEGLKLRTLHFGKQAQVHTISPRELEQGARRAAPRPQLVRKQTPYYQPKSKQVPRKKQGFWCWLCCGPYEDDD